MRARGPAGSSSVKAEGQLERSKGTIRQKMDREEEREAEAVTAKEEARPVSPMPAIAPGVPSKPTAEGPATLAVRVREKPSAAANRRLEIEVAGLISEDGDAVMTDAES